MQTFRKKPYLIERLISAVTYLSAGGVGFLWLLIAALLKKQVTKFVMYHVMQSIFISILFYLLSVFANFILIIVYKIPIINIVPYLFNMPIAMFFNLSIIQLFTTLIILYLSITAALGYYSYLPWISDIVKINTGQR